MKIKNIKLLEMLIKDAEADKAKAELTLDLLGNHQAGIGDHSTGDFYDNAKEALTALVDANDRLELLNNMSVSIDTSQPRVIE